MKANKKFYLAGTFFSILIFFAIIFYLTRNNDKLPTDSHVKTELDTINDVNEFGFNSDSLIEAKSTIKRNETLSDILLNYKFNTGSLHDVITEAKKNFDVRNIRYGHNYYVFTNKKDSTDLVYFIYQEDPVHYVVISLKDSINVYSASKKVIVKLKSVSGIINRSLYETLTKSNVDPELAVKLADIYAWQIDFFKIQKGDYFKVLYNEDYVDNETAGIREILGACFNHGGENYFAINFRENDRNNFYDQNGKSLRKAFLKAPLKFTRISSRYTNRRYHPILHRYLPHHGVDYAAPTGTPIHSVGDGIIVKKGRDKYDGNFIKIRHNNVYSTEYLHLSRYAKGIKRGKKVLQGQTIGYVGSTGLATGPHLDFRFFKNGHTINPLKVKSPPTKSIDKQIFEVFDSTRNKIITKLDSIKLNIEDQNTDKVSTSSLNSTNKSTNG